MEFLLFTGNQVVRVRGVTKPSAALEKQEIYCTSSKQQTGTVFGSREVVAADGEEANEEEENVLIACFFVRNRGD